MVSNFISGVIILLDKSNKPSDTTSLGDTFGWIRELRSRYVSVVTRDGREYLIPNEDFITEKVINWLFTDKLAIEAVERSQETGLLADRVRRFVLKLQNPLLDF